MSRIFISYASKDYQTAERLYEDLLAAGHRPWLAPHNIPPGSNWKDWITEKIRTSQYFLALLSRHALRKRGYVQAEVKEALDVLLSLPAGRRYLIPVRLENCHPKETTLTAVHWVDLFPRYEEGFAKILQVLPRRKRLRPYFYAEHGVIIPDHISAWPIERQVQFIRTTLWPALSDRAHKAYEYVDDEDGAAARRAYAEVLLINTGTERGFLGACHRFLEQ